MFWDGWCCCGHLAPLCVINLSWCLGEFNTSNSLNVSNKRVLVAVLLCSQSVGLGGDAPTQVYIEAVDASQCVDEGSRSSDDLAVWQDGLDVIIWLCLNVISPSVKGPHVEDQNGYRG